jgi:uncharacterized lipoprotein YddW (UPF0748 family)
MVHCAVFMGFPQTVAVLVAVLAAVTAEARVDVRRADVVGPIDERHEDQPEKQRSEVRALWVLRTSLGSPDTIRRMVRSAAASGFNTLLVQVRGHGDAYFNQGIEMRAAALAAQPEGFDPLAETLEHARAAGLTVHAWLNVNLVAAVTELPASAEHIIYRHPEWLMVPRELAPELMSIDVRSPEYLGRLARWTRANAARVEGLYASPLHAGAIAHVAAVVSDVARRYAVDGVHLDFVRYPADDFDYSRDAVAAFRKEMRSRLSSADRGRVDALEQLDPFAYPGAFADDWRLFRRAQLTALVARVRTAVRAARASAMVSAAVMPDARQALETRLQDWRTWIDNGFVDVLCPMAYTREPREFAAQIADVRALAGSRPVWAGIGAYRLTPTQTIDAVSTARRLGANGVVLFSYDSLIRPPNGSDYLNTIGRAVFSGSY